MDPNAQQQLIETLKNANSVLVTVSKNPTVDQLAACIGLTLFLNKIDKHATAVYSGVTPSTIEFLQPEKTIENTTDSLRDFIISLDKSKADKLRYKVEDEVVKIFITPYRTSLSDKDLNFSQGDFNVDAVIALGVLTKEELDQAIVAHGRILHDAIVVGVTLGTAQSELGTIQWHDPIASSLSEMVTIMVEALQPQVIDNQIATALLTGLVAETDRFSNDKTTPQVMTLSAQLMSAGANQQLIANKLSQTVETSLHAPDTLAPPLAPPPGSGEGSLSIEHDELDLSQLTPISGDDEEPEKAAEEKQTENPPPDNDSDDGYSLTSQRGKGNVLQPPERGGTLTANTVAEYENPDPSTDPLSNVATPPLLNRDYPEAVSEPEAPAPPPPVPDEPPEQPQGPVVFEPTKVQDDAPAEPQAEQTPPVSSVLPDLKVEEEQPPASESSQPEPELPLPKEPPGLPPITPEPDTTLADIEKLVGSDHADQEAKAAATAAASVEDARNNVQNAAVHSDGTPTPIAALNAQPLGDSLHQAPAEASADKSQPDPEAKVLDPDAPPEVPPPMMPQFFDQGGQAHNPYLNPNDNQQK